MLKSLFLSTELSFTSVYVYVAFDSPSIKESIDLNLNPSCVWKKTKPADASFDLFGIDLEASEMSVAKGFFKLPKNS